MDKNQPHAYPHLFTVRLWIEELGNGQTEWRGQVQHVLTGEKRYFRNWSTLIAFLMLKLQELEGDNG
jgi:hypothetical protein